MRPGDDDNNAWLNAQIWKTSNKVEKEKLLYFFEWFLLQKGIPGPESDKCSS